MNSIKPIKDTGDDKPVSKLQFWWWDVQDRIHKLTSPFRKVRDFIIRVFHYLPILWQDKDFDWVFIITMLQFKLKRTREYLVKENIIVDIEEISKQIEIAENLIDKILKDDFCKEEQDAHDLKWGETNDYFTPNKNGIGSILNFSKTNANTPEEKEQERSEQFAIYGLGEKRKADAWDKLYAHLRANLENWWS